MRIFGFDVEFLLAVVRILESVYLCRRSIKKGLIICYLFHMQSNTARHTVNP